MTSYATTKLSSKGQVVIPEEIRKNLGLRDGDLFVVIGEGDTVILKSISPPNMKEFDALVARARSEARRAKLTKADVKAAIVKVRRRARR